METQNNISHCPATGLPLEKPGDWFDHRIGNYTFSYSKIGESIVFVANRGDMKEFSVETHYKLLHAFAKRTGVVYPLIEIRDIRELKGKPPSSEMKKQKTYFIEHQDLFAGFIMCNVPFWLRAVVQAALKRYKVSMEFVVCKTQEDALANARRLLEKIPLISDDAPDRDYIFDMLEFRPQWQFEDVEKKIYYHNAVIPGKIFYSRIQAKYLGLDDFIRIAPFFEKVFEDGMLTGTQYIRIVDYSRVHKSSIKLRKAYAQMQIRLHEKYHCSPGITYICGANLFIKTSLKLFSTFVKHRFVFLETVELAFDRINLQLHNRYKDQVIPVSQGDIEEINNLCGMLVWDEEEAKKGSEIQVSKDNRLYELYETISLVRRDLVALRQREIAQAEALRKALKAAKAANQAKTDFLANMSHELLTPLNGITGMLELVSDTGLSDEQKEYTDTARSCADQLQSLVSDIFDFMRLTRGELNTENKKFHLDTVMTSLESKIAQKLKEKEIVYGYTIDENVPKELYGDPDSLTKILHHLIGNSLKFVEKGSIGLHITGQDETPEKISLLFEVTDTGVGIPEEKQSGLFDMFTQADTSTTRRYEGVGMGLSITKQLVDLLDGDIGFDSREGCGSRFWFRVDYKIPKAPDTKKFGVTKQEPENKGNTPLQILIVDDNRMNQKVAGKMLAKMGHKTALADNGQQAVQMFAPGKYDLIFMDLQMPVMDGEAAAKNIRIIESKTKNHTPIIALSANATKQAQKTSLASGMDAFMTKPLKKKVLQKELKKFIQ